MKHIKYYEGANDLSLDGRLVKDAIRSKVKYFGDFFKNGEKYNL
jgi:hypothetical protein